MLYMLYIGYLMFLDGQIIKKISLGNSIAFGKSTSQRSYSKQRTQKMEEKRHKYGQKHALHSLEGHFR